MKKKGYQLWKPYKKVGTIIFILAFVLLFFSNKIEVVIYNWVMTTGNWLPYNSKTPILIGLVREMGLSVNKFLLLLMNFGMVFTVFSPLKGEDERIEKIRSFVYQLVFRMIVIMALTTGLLLKENPSILLISLVMQLYYLILFRISIYRDASIVYLNEEQLVENGKKTKKSLYIRGIIVGCAFGLGFGYVNAHYGSASGRLYMVIGLCIIIIFSSVEMVWEKEINSPLLEPVESLS